MKNKKQMFWQKETDVREYILNIADKTEHYKRSGDRFSYKTGEMTEYSKPVSAKKLVGIMRAADNCEKNTEITDDMADRIIASYPHLEKFRSVVLRRFYLRPTILLLTAIEAGDTTTADLIIEGGYHLGKNQLEAMRVKDAEIKCVGKSDGRWLFRVKQENKVCVKFTHEKGADVVFNAKSTRFISPELSRKLDEKQEEVEKYVSDALNENDGFFRINAGCSAMCVRETKKENGGAKDFIEICYIDDFKDESNISWGVAEVEDVANDKVKYSIDRWNDFSDIPEQISPKTAEKVLAALPTLDREKLENISEFSAGLILYALKINNRRMMLKVLYMTGLATREECDELTAVDGKTRFIRTRELYTPEMLRVEKIRKRNIYGSFFRGRYYGYEMTVVIDGRSYPARVYTDGLRMRFDSKIRLYSDHKAFILQLDEAAREEIKKACVEFDEKEETK